MKNKLIVLLICLFPLIGFSQGGSGSYVADGMSEWANSLRGLQPMIAEMGQQMMGTYGGVLRSITTILALSLIFYLFSRIYRSLLAGEPIDWWGLLKPAKITLLVMCYPIIVSLIQTVLSPIRGVTSAQNVDSHTRVVAARRAALEQSEDWVIFIGKDGEGDIEKYTEKYGASDVALIGESLDRMTFNAHSAMVSLKYQFKAIVSEILRLVYESAILVIHFISTFYMVVLIIFGPIPLALTLFSGFENGFSSWIAQFIDKFLWLPIANVLAALLNQMQLGMINASVQAEALGEGSFFSVTDFGYFMFMIIGIAGFLCVPSISGMIVSAGTPSSAIGSAATAVATGGASAVGAAAGATWGGGKAAAKGANSMYQKITGKKDKVE